MIVKFGKELIDVGSVDSETKIDDVVERLRNITGCAEIKLIAPGKVINAGTEKTFGTLYTLTKISVIGSKRSDIESIEKPLPC